MKRKCKLQAVVLVAIMVAELSVGCGTAERLDASTVDAQVSGNMSREELAEIESDFMHMENNFFLDQEFADEDDIDWEAIYERRSKDTFEPDEYKCVSGNKKGYLYRVRLERVDAYPNKEKADYSSFKSAPDRIVVFEKKGNKYTFKKNEFLWEENCDDIFDLNLGSLGQCKAVVFYDSRYREPADIVILSNNKRIAKVYGAYFSKIDYIYPVDFDADGYFELAISGKRGSKKNLEFMEFYTGWDDEFTDFSFEICSKVSDIAMEELGGDYSLDKVKEFVLLNDIVELDFWGKNNEYHYDSYKEAYYDLASKVEAEEDLNSYDDCACCRYGLEKYDDDKIPELVVINSAGETKTYTYKDNDLYVYEGKDSPSDAEFSFAELEMKLGFNENKVTPLNENDVENAGITVPEEATGTVSKIYLVEKAKQKKYLVMFTRDEWDTGEYYVYNLNGDRIIAPVQSTGDYIYCLNDIKDSSNFKLMSKSELTSETLTQKKFYIDPCGVIKSPDESVTYIEDMYE